MYLIWLLAKRFMAVINPFCSTKGVTGIKLHSIEESVNYSQVLWEWPSGFVVLIYFR